MSVLLAAALGYAARGWPVIPLHSLRDGACSCGRPCASPGKHPRLSRGLLAASTHQAKIQGWWARWPDAHIGIRTGPAPHGGGIWVLDLDAGTDAEARVEQAEREAAPSPASQAPWRATLAARTGGGGLHLVYPFGPRLVAWLDERGLTLPSRQGIGGKGLDVRAGDAEGGSAGYIVVAPSGHVSGQEYEWEDADATITPAPLWLLRLVCVPIDAPRAPYVAPSVPVGGRREEALVAGALRAACAAIAAASPGERHETLLHHARRMGGVLAWGGLSRGEIEGELCRAGESTGKPPGEVRRTVLDALAHGELSPLPLPADRPEYAARQAAPAAPPAPVPPVHDRLSDARALAARALGTLYAEQTTRAERATVARELAGSVDLLTELAGHRSEWEAWCTAVGAAGGFGEHLRGIRRAVSAEQDAREQDAREARPARTASEAWRARLSTTEEGKIRADYANVVTILSMDPRYATLRTSTLGQVVELAGDEMVEAPAVARCCEYLRDQYGIGATAGAVRDAIYAVAKERQYSPVREYLERVRPLRRNRPPTAIDAILPEVLGIAEPTPTQIEMVRRFLIGAVARAMVPGCKMDTALVLVGAQGAKKSTFFAALFDEFFADSPIPIGNKDAPIQLSRVWGYEASELEDLTSKRTAEVVKQFMGSSSDLYRPPFERSAVSVPRHTVLCGSANPRDILTDSTGSRRFWILPVPAGWVVPIQRIREQRDQIWSEALEMYGDGSGDGEGGRPWWFERDEDAAREVDAQQYQISDDWQPLVEQWLARSPDEDSSSTVHRPAPGVAGSFTRQAVLTGIGLMASQIDRKASVRVAAILTRLGWVEVHSPAGFRGARVWQIQRSEDVS